MPTFNLKGESTVATLTGGICTFMIICVFLTYGSLKLIHLIEKHNPSIITVTQEAVFGYDNEMNLDEMGFRFAFTVESMNG